MITWQVKQQIIDQTNIVEVVGEVVQLSKKGSSYFGLCPFHNDRHPSMSVNQEKKMFNCFSCNTKGNVIYFWSRFNHISEDQATIQLAKRIGIEISESDNKEAIQNERLYKVMNEASNFYQFYLNNSEEGLVALDYLKARGIDEKIRNELKIGLASSERDYLNKALNQKNCSELDQIEVGLVKLDDKNNTYDTFRERIMFPITNPSGQIVGFSGRIYTKSDQAKYINSVDNAIFHKGQILYHFHEALDAIKKNDKIFLLEGFMDVIACMKAGINYGVATMGTALTSEHIKLILSATKNIVLFFDGDGAGINAMKKSCGILAGYGILPKAIVLPNNLDPDEYVKNFGVEKFLKYITENEKSAYQWLYDLALKNYIKGDLESTEKFKKEVFNFIRISKQNTIIEHFIRKLSTDTDISYDILVKDFGKSIYTTPSIEESFEIEQKKIKKPVRNNKIKPKVVRAYQIILRHMIESKEQFLIFNDKFSDTFYLDNSLIIYFEFIKKMALFYVDQEVMDHDDFLEIAKKLDEANGVTKYTDLAKTIFEDSLVNPKDLVEFEQCMKTIMECQTDLSRIRLYNKALETNDIDDIRNFENVRKDHVKILPREE